MHDMSEEGEVKTLLDHEDNTAFDEDVEDNSQNIQEEDACEEDDTTPETYLFDEEENLLVDIIPEHLNEDEYEDENDSDVDEIDEFSNYLEDHLERVTQPLKVDLQKEMRAAKKGMYNGLNIEL